jgi:hypothetical protein
LIVLAICSAILILVAILFYEIWLGYFHIPLIGGPRVEAVTLALNTENARQARWNYINEWPAVGEVVPGGGGDRSGYINASGELYTVPVSYGYHLVGENLEFTVDVVGDRVLATETYWRKTYPAFAEAVVPPGACWYRRIDGFIAAAVAVEPADAVYNAIVLNFSELEKLKKGSAYTALDYTSSATGQPIIYDGSIPQEGEFSIYISRIGGNDQPYLVIRNPGAEDLQVKYKAMM